MPLNNLSSVFTASPVDQLTASMSVSALQQQVIASNVANRDVAGYQRVKVQFERALADGLPRASVVPDPVAQGTPLEQDLASMSTNATRYQAMARMLSRYYSIASAITAPGRN